MIEITKYVTAAQQNRSAQPVDPVVKSHGTGEEKRKSPQETVAAAKEAQKTQEAMTGPEELSPADVEKWTDVANDFLDSANLSLRLSVNKEAKYYVAKLIDENTGATIREFPSKQVQQMVARLREMVNDLYSGGKSVLVDKTS